MDAIVARIEQVRKQRGLNRSAFSRQLGVPVQSYNNYVEGQASDPTVRLLLGIKRIYGVSADWLLCGESGP